MTMVMWEIAVCLLVMGLVGFITGWFFRGPWLFRRARVVAPVHGNGAGGGLEGELTICRRRILVLERELKSCRDGAGTCRSELDVVRIRCGTLQTELDAVRHHPRSSETELQRLRIRISELEVELGTCRGAGIELVAARARMEQLEEKLRVCRGRVQQLESQLHEHDHGAGAVDSDRLHKLRRELEQCRARARSLADELSACRSSTSDCEADLHRITLELEDRRREGTQLLASLKSCRAHNRTLRVALLDGDLVPGGGIPPAVVIRDLDTPFVVHTRLLDEKEIDVDDREATVEVTIAMAHAGPWALKATHVRATLHFDFEQHNIAIEGQRCGPVVIEKDGVIEPSSPLVTRIKVSTGIFSDQLAAHRTSAPVGEHLVEVSIAHVLSPVSGPELPRLPMALRIARD